MPLGALVTKFGGGPPAGMVQADGGKTTLSAALFTKFGEGFPAGMLQADGGATTLSIALTIKFGGRLPAGMLLADDYTDNPFSGSGHQVWRWISCGDAVG